MKRKLLWVILPLPLLVCMVLSGFAAAKMTRQMIEKADSHFRSEIAYSRKILLLSPQREER